MTHCRPWRIKSVAVMQNEYIPKDGFDALSPKEFEQHLARFPLQESQISSLNEAHNRFETIYFRTLNAFQIAPIRQTNEEFYPWSLDDALRLLFQKTTKLKRLRSAKCSPSITTEISKNLEAAHIAWKEYFLAHALIQGWQICGCVLNDKHRFRLPLSLFEIDKFRIHINWGTASYGNLEFRNLTFLVPGPHFYQAANNTKPPPFLNKKALLKSLNQQGLPLRNDDTRSSAFFLTLYSQLHPLPKLAKNGALHAVFRSKDHLLSKRTGPKSVERTVRNEFVMKSKDSWFRSKSDIAKRLSKNLTEKSTRVCEKTIIKHLDAANKWEIALLK